MKLEVETMEGKAWMKVKLPSGFVYLSPQICTCCLSPTEETKELHHSRQVAADAYSGTYETTSVELPLCRDCKAHQKAGHVTFPLIALGILLLTLLLLIPTMHYLEEWSTWAIILITSLSLSVFIFPPMLFEVYRNIWWPKKHPGHARASTPVRYKVNADNTITFVFYNRDYGKLFAEVNKQQFLEIKKEIEKIIEKDGSAKN